MMVHASWTRLLGVLALLSISVCAVGEPAAPAAKCKRDLAKRLGIKAGEVELRHAEPVTWPDASLGLPRPGEMYAQVLTPGWVITLEAPAGTYVYAAGGSAVKYAGPVASWRWSALYIEPVAGDPNLNGNLARASLIGTHPSVVVAGVSYFWQQEDASILAKRRTSRSGHDLLYVGPGGSAAERLDAAFDYAHAVVNSDGSQWAAISRALAGGAWSAVGGTVAGGDGHSWSAELPTDVMPATLSWTGERLVAQGDKTAYELAGTDEGRSWSSAQPYLPLTRPDLMLNKSESIAFVNVDGGAQVVRRWFTGDDTLVATVPGFAGDGIQLSPDLRFVLLNGRDGDDHRAYTVDIASGEVIPIVKGLTGAASLGLQPPSGADALLDALASVVATEG